MFGSVSGFGVPEQANPNRTKPVRLRNEIFFLNQAVLAACRVLHPLITFPFNN
jgi:hypothetical protein